VILSLKTLLILSAALATQPDRTADIEAAVVSYYENMLRGRVESWDIDVRRLPSVKAVSFEITNIHEDNTPSLPRFLAPSLPRSLAPSIPRGTRLCWIGTIADGREKTIPVTLTIKTMEMLPVARCNIPPRTALNDSLVEWRVMAANKLGATRFPAADLIESYWAKVRIPVGSIIAMPRLARIPTVVIGQKLDLVVRSGQVEIKIEGKALQDGYTGDRIRVMNTYNGKHLKGVVESGDLVVLE